MIGGRLTAAGRVGARMTPRARVACLLLGFAAVLAVGLFQVSRRRAIVEVGYAIGKTTSELRRLDEEDRRLNLELSVLTAPARVERLAGELGMVRPGPEAIRTAPAATARPIASLAR